MRLSKHMMIAIMILLIVLSVAITAYAVSVYYSTITGLITVTRGSTGSITASPSTFSIAVANGGSASTLITLKNTGSIPLTISGVNDTSPEVFPVTINDTGLVIQPGHSTICKLTIFDPGRVIENTYTVPITFYATG